MNKEKDYEEFIHERKRRGIIVSLYKDNALIPDSCSASVLHNQEPLNSQLNSNIFAMIKPDYVYAYSSEEDARTSRAFYDNYYEANDCYYPEDLCADYGVTPLYRRYLWVVSIDTANGKLRARTAKLDTRHAINLQLEEKQLANAYLCASKAEAELLAHNCNLLIKANEEKTAYTDRNKCRNIPVLFCNFEGQNGHRISYIHPFTSTTSPVSQIENLDNWYFRSNHNAEICESQSKVLNACSWYDLDDNNIHDLSVPPHNSTVWIVWTEVCDSTPHANLAKLNCYALLGDLLSVFDIEFAYLCNTSECAGELIAKLGIN